MARTGGTKLPEAARPCSARYRRSSSSAQLSAASLGLLIANRITRALSAALNELLVPGQPVNVDLPVARVTITAHPLVPVIGTGSVQLPPMSVSGMGR